MKEQFSCLILLGILAFCSPNPAPLNNNESEARLFIQDANNKLNTIYEEMRLVGHDLDINPNLMFRYQKLQNVTNSIAELAQQSRNFDTSQFKDEELKYILEIISQQADEGILGTWWFEKMLDAINAVEAIGSRRNIAKFHKKKVNLAYFPDIENIIAYTNNSAELKHYWKELREHNSDLVLRNLITITDVILEAAKATGISPLEFWMKGYNIIEMENIMNEIQPLYLQLHAFIRSRLYKKYGDKVIKSNGVIPDHLFRQVIAQIWTNASIIDEMFSLAKLPPYDNILKNNNYDALELFKIANNFYKSLGFDSLPENYLGSDIRMNKESDEGDCKPTVYDFSPNVCMYFCHKMDFRTFLQAHGYMGQIYYAREKNNLPAYFFEAHDLELSVGEAAILSASTLGHLKAIGLLNNFDLTEEIEFNRILRMGFHTLLNVPQHFVHSKVMADFFSGKIELGLLNKHYWKLMDQYVGVGPPMNRVSNTFDFPVKFYTELNENRQARKFNSEVLGYQFYKKLCQISGKYSEDELHKCDFFGSKDVGDALKKMMKLGSSRRKNEVLKTLFPENPTMSSDSLLEYYKPMKIWLTEKNAAENVQLGWTHSNKKINRVIIDSGEEYEDD